jgi:hypothetical protein
VFRKKRILFVYSRRDFFDSEERGSKFHVNFHNSFHLEKEISKGSEIVGKLFIPRILTQVRSLVSPLNNFLLCSVVRHEGVWGSRCIDPHFIVLGTNWRCVVSFTYRPVYPREKASSIHWIGDWVEPRAGLDDVENRKFLTLLKLEL